MLARGIHHLGVAVLDLDDALATYERLFGAELEHRASVAEQGVEAAAVLVGDGRVELLAPLGEASPIAAFLERNPLGGQHHLAFEVPDIARARAEFEGMGKRVLGPTRIGAHGTPVFFVHPKDMGGMLVEIMETPKAA